MRFLVTGAEGFIGQHLMDELVMGGERPHWRVGVDRRDVDLRAPGGAARLIRESQPDRVIHLAAKVGRLFGEQDLAETITNNVLASANVARACAEAGVPLTYASSSEVYGDGGSDSVWSEGELYNAHPHNAYGLTKRQGEEFCRLYAPHGLQVARLSMPYGPGLPPGEGRAALVTFIENARKRQRIYVHRGAERSWCYVGDTCRGLRMIVESGQAGTWNVGRDDNRLPMVELAAMACFLAGAPASLIHEVDPPERQTVVKRLSSERLRGLGWRPEVALPEGMSRVLAWLEQREAAAA